MGLKTRLEKIEKTVDQAEQALLIDWTGINPEASGLSCGDRSFPNMKAAIEVLQGELGRPVEPIILRVNYEAPIIEGNVTWN